MLNEQEIADMVRDGTLNSTLQKIADAIRKTAATIAKEKKPFGKGDINDQLVYAELEAIEQELRARAHRLKLIQDKFYPNGWSSTS